MLRLAVKRDSRIAQRDAKTKRSLPEAKVISTEQSAYLICDSRSKGFPIQHVSKGFEAFFGCNAAECVGSSCSHIVSGRGFDHSATAALNKVAATAGIDVETSIDRMSSAAEKAVQSAAVGGSMPVILISVVNRSGDLCVCELSMCKKQHSTLGWAYHAALLKDISGAVSVTKLFKSAQTEQSYEQLCSEWRQATRGAVSDLAPSGLGDLSDELDAVAEQLWKNELAKGIKPKASNKSREADTSSIWSRSTASTLASRTQTKETTTTAKAFHFGALLGSQGLEQSADAECDDVARKRFAPATETEKDVTRSVRRRETLESGAAKAEESDGFLTASEDEKEAWEECDAVEPTESNSRSSSSLLMEDVVNPVKHVDRPVLRRMKIPFVIAAPTVPGFPVCLRSKGFEELFGPSMHVKVGCDARDVLKPSDPKETKVWQSFFDSIMEGQFYLNENVDGPLDGWQLPDNGRLPAGEIAFIQTFRGRFGNPMDCLVYLKHVELDDCPFLLALHAYLPSDAELDSSREKLFARLNARLDEVIAEMASEYVYYAPMRRQTKYHA